MKSGQLARSRFCGFMHLPAGRRASTHSAQPATGTDRHGCERLLKASENLC